MASPSSNSVHTVTSCSHSELSIDHKNDPDVLEKCQTAASGIDTGIPLWRRCVVLFVLSWVALGATFSSTSLLSVAKEISIDLHTTPETINISTGGVILAMGLSSFIWSPLAEIFGRRQAYCGCIASLLGFTFGASFSKTLPVFLVMRVLSGFSGTFFHVSAQTIIADYFPPVQRGTATGFFLCGTVLGPPLGPCIAGIITTYASWRVILWLQVGMVGAGLILSIAFIPAGKRDSSLSWLSMTWKESLATFNPLPVFRVMAYPNVGFTHLSCGFLSFAQYFLLAAPRQILSSQFHPQSPLTVGLFYIAPGAGFILGTIVGGRYSDMKVRSWIVKREGVRLPQDRLNSGMLPFFLIVPTASLAYGWGLQYIDFTRLSGGLAFPAVFAFLIGTGLMAAFASLNTYCAEALPKKRREVVAGKYVVQYIFGAFASAGTTPLIASIHVGPACTIATILVLVAGVLTLTTAKRGLNMQHWAEQRALT